MEDGSYWVAGGCGDGVAKLTTSDLSTACYMPDHEASMRAAVLNDMGNVCEIKPVSIRIDDPTVATVESTLPDEVPTRRFIVIEDRIWDRTDAHYVCGDLLCITGRELLMCYRLDTKKEGIYYLFKPAKIYVEPRAKGVIFEFKGCDTNMEQLERDMKRVNRNKGSGGV
jgi:hypothetical protein